MTVNPWLVNIEAPGRNDVVYGRGGLANNHDGNRRFREMICTAKDEYARCSRHEKTALAERLAQQWRGQSPPGRFIKQDKATDLWFDVGAKKAREKCSQTLREGPLKTTPKDEETEQVNSEQVNVNESNIPPPPPPPMCMAPPPPPPTSSSSMSDVISPPQMRPSRNLNGSLNTSISPTCVMDMKFYCVESVDKAAPLKKEICRSDAAMSSFFSQGSSGTNSFGFPRRQKSKREEEPSTFNGEDYACEQPPAKRPAFGNPLSAFMGGLVRDNLHTRGPKTITIVEDNARASPVPQPQEEEPREEVVVLATGRTGRVSRIPTPCTSNQSAFPNSRARPVPPPRTLARRDRSVDRKLEPESLDRSDHTLWSMTSRVDFDMEEDGSVFSKYSNHRSLNGNNNSNHTSTFSVSSGRTIEDVMEELDTLPTLFRKRCDTGSSAIDIFEKAYPGTKQHNFNFPPQAVQQVVVDDHMDFEEDLSMASFSDDEDDYLEQDNNTRLSFENAYFESGLDDLMVGGA